jgi:DNA-binding protein HU-beta
MKELIAAVAAQTGLSQKSARAFVDAVLNEITARLLSDGKVRLGDFGTFAVHKRGARKGRNPRTGEKIDIPAALLARFKPGAALRDRLSTLSEIPGK